mmetsp:Transcript_6347/g.11455  ORF Transcript_6347/g.11455 Transcript_6347/m.11455 type:complete len:393 (+) Transcript_6347:140-1318(+)
MPSRGPSRDFCLAAREVVHVGAVGGGGGAAEAHGGGAAEGGGVGGEAARGGAAGGEGRAVDAVATVAPHHPPPPRLVRHPHRQVSRRKRLRRLKARPKLWTRPHRTAARHTPEPRPPLLALPLAPAAAAAALAAPRGGGRAVRVALSLLLLLLLLPRCAPGLPRAPHDVGVRQVEVRTGAEEEVGVEGEEHLERARGALHTLTPLRPRQPGAAVQQAQLARLPRKLLRHRRQTLRQGRQTAAQNWRQRRSEQLPHCHHQRRVTPRRHQRLEVVAQDVEDGLDGGEEELVTGCLAAGGAGGGGRGAQRHPSPLRRRLQEGRARSGGGGEGVARGVGGGPSGQRLQRPHHRLPRHKPSACEEGGEVGSRRGARDGRGAAVLKVRHQHCHQRVAA